MRHPLRIVAILLLLLVGDMPLAAQTQPASAPATAASTQSATAPATPAVTPVVPIAEIVSQSDALNTKLQAIDTDLSSNPITNTVDEQLPLLVNEVNSRSEDTAKVLVSNASLEALRGIESSWQNLGATLMTWQKDLTVRATTLNAEVAGLQKYEDDWNQTRAATASAKLPPELRQRIDSAIDAINQTLTKAERQRELVLRFQAQVAAQNTQVNTELKGVSARRDELLNKLFVRDSPALWSPEVRQNAGQDFVDSGQHTFVDQTRALRAYVVHYPDRFTIHAVVLGILTAALFWARGRFKVWVRDEATLAPAAPVFASPLATAFVLSMLLSIWLHPQAPRLFWVISGAAAIIPAAFLIRRLTEQFFHPLLYALIALYFLDQIRAVIVSLHVWPRILLLAEMIAACIFLVWFMQASRKAASAAGAEPIVSISGHEARRRRSIRLACRFAVVLFALTLLANVVGYVNFAVFLGGGVLRCAYVALILYAGLAVADGLVIILLHLRPVSRLRAIRGHAMLLRARTHRVLGWGAIALWVYVVLNILMIREPVTSQVEAVLEHHLVLGVIDITLFQIIAGAVTVWASFLLSRFIRFLLEEEVYTHVKLPRGIGSAVNSLLHYVVLVFGFAVAAGVLGVPLTNLTILTGAFGVGIGFGLQTIINNFFSGIIVLIERPVQVGDIIEMDAMVGTITRIGIRASVIRTPAGSEIIMPNGRLIAEKVINWTLTDRCRGLELPITTDAAADPQRVMKLLESTAGGVKDIADKPAPIAQVVSFSPAATTFSLRVWTKQVEDWMQVRSDLNLALRAALDVEKITLK